jgi:hypothetical protein
MHVSRDYYDDDVEQYELVEDQIEEMELLEEQERINELEIPDVRWKEDIEKIPAYDVKLEEIEKAKNFLKEEKVLRERVDNGDLSLGMYESITKPIMKKATTRCGLASVGLTYDHLGDLSEDGEFIVTGEGNLKMAELKERLKDKIEDIGPDAAEELADRMLAEERLGRDAHDLIKRQSRLKREGGKK